MQPFFDKVPEILDTLKTQGAFLVATDEAGKPNVMTIGWGAISWMWRKPCFVLPVRLSRYTHTMLKIGGCFTVSFPKKGEWTDALKYTGTRSGRDQDKFQGAGLSAVAAKKVPVPVVRNCEHYLECRILSASDLKMEEMDQEVTDAWYANALKDDIHTIYFAEILAAY